MSRWLSIGIVLVVAAAIILAFLVGRSPMDYGSESEQPNPAFESEPRDRAATDIINDAPAESVGERVNEDPFDFEEPESDPPPRTSAGLRETPVSATLPILDNEDFAGRETPPTKSDLAARLPTPVLQTEPHPLKPGHQVVETNDGPRGPNPIAPDPGAPGPALLMVTGPNTIDALDTDPLEIPTDNVVLGPGDLNKDIDLSKVEGPGQGTFDPDSPGPDED